MIYSLYDFMFLCSWLLRSWSPELEKLEADIKKIEMQLEKDGAPYTPGRNFEWKR